MTTKYLKTKSTYVLGGGYIVMRTGENPTMLGHLLTEQEADSLIQRLESGENPPGVIVGSGGNSAGGMYNDSFNHKIRRDGLPMDAKRAEYFEMGKELETIETQTPKELSQEFSAYLNKQGRVKDGD